MRVLEGVDPRRVALLLVVVPALLAAGALRAEPPVPRAGAAAAARVTEVPRQVLTLEPAPVAAPAAEPAPRPLVRHAARAGRPHSLGGGRRVGDRTPAHERRGRAALRALGYDAAALGYRVRFLPARDGVLGKTNRRTRTITVHVRPGQSEQVLRTTLAHEIGHALDFTHGTPERRAAYREARRLPAGSWFPCDRCNDFGSPAGDFSEVFALWLAGPGDFRGRLRPAPTSDELRRIAPLFEVPAPAPAAAPSPAPQPSSPPAGQQLPDLIPPPPAGCSCPPAWRRAGPE